MKNVCTILLGLLLAACLTLYGPFSTAMAGGSAAFSMEICADGVAKTVLIDADGNPVEPDQVCAKCLTCCQATGALIPVICAAAPSFVLLDMNVDNPSAQDPVLTKRNIHPAPRGPPVVQLYMLNMPELISLDQSFTGQPMRSDGRPLFKDADA